MRDVRGYKRTVSFTSMTDKGVVNDERKNLEMAGGFFRAEQVKFCLYCDMKMVPFN